MSDSPRRADLIKVLNDNAPEVDVDLTDDELGRFWGLQADAILAWMDTLPPRVACTCPCHTTPGYWHVAACCPSGNPA